MWIFDKSTINFTKRIQMLTFTRIICHLYLLIWSYDCHYCDIPGNFLPILWPVWWNSERNLTWWTDWWCSTHRIMVWLKTLFVTARYHHCCTGDQRDNIWNDTKVSSTKVSSTIPHMMKLWNLHCQSKARNILPTVISWRIVLKFLKYTNCYREWKIIDVIKTRGKGKKKQYLVHYRGWPSTYDEWKNADEMKQM